MTTPREAKMANQAGDVESMRKAGELHETARRLGAALEWYERAGNLKDVESMRKAGDLHEKAGRPTDALRWYQRAGR
jgi:TPR repeat protein